MTTLEKLSAALADRYAIEREIGQGGMATVYLAQDIRHRRKVAIKVLHPELTAVLGPERFLNEIELTANLQHPHILPLFDSGAADTLLFYVMPFVEGETLRNRLSREHQLPVAEALRIAGDVADALEYAHKHGVVHRDIKPENVLLHDGRPLVADFGIALAVQQAGGARMTQTGMSLGTPQYMAPEQAMGDKSVDHRADIYALGAVTYEMLTGEPPFTGPNAQAVVAKILTTDPSSLVSKRRSVPAHVESAVLCALEKTPADRFNSAAAFAEALAGRGPTLPTRAATGTMALATTRSRRDRTLAALPWALFAAAFAAGALGWMRTSEPAIARHRITLWKAGTPLQGPARHFAVSSDGRSIAFVDTADGQAQLWLKERHRLDPAIIPGTVGANSPSFSPDGEWIAFEAAGKLKKVPRLGGSPITLSDSTSLTSSIAWLSDGTILFTNPAFELLATHEGGGPHRRVLAKRPDDRDVVFVSAIPGGSVVLIATCTPGCPDGDLRALDVETGDAKILATDAIQGWYLDGRVVFIRRDGGGFAAPFDRRKLALSGPSVPVLEGVRTGVITADIAVSPAGTLVYIPGAALAGATVEPVWVTRRGNVSAVDSSWTFVSSANWGISLSPDGRRLAVGARVAGSDDIWIKELANGVFRRLTFEGSNQRPVGWIHDGRSLIYTSINRGNSDLYIRSADGTGSASVFADLPRPIFEGALTPDSTRIVVRIAGGPGRRDIVLMRPGDTAAAPLVASAEYDEVGPTLSRDGRWLAYASNETGRNEVYVRPFPDVNAGKWQISRGGGSEPLWAYSGRELFFRDASDNMVAAAVVTNPTFSSSAQSNLFPTRGLRRMPVARGYDVTRDDNRFVFTRTVGGDEGDAPLPVVLVENWGAELRNATRRGQ